MNAWGYCAFGWGSTGLLVYTEQWPFVGAAVLFVIAGLVETFR